MAEIDGSITAGIGRNVLNPLAQMGEMANTMNALNQNRLFQAKQAAGQAYQRAIGPDGRLDENALMRGVAQDPRAAMAAGETATASMGRQVQQVEIDGAQLTQHLNKLDAINKVLFPVAAKGKDATVNDVTQALGYLVSTKVLTPQEALAESQNIPGEPGAVPKYVMDHLINGLDQEGKLKAVGGGTPTIIEQGDRKVLVRLGNLPGAPATNATTGQPIGPADLQQRLSPEAQATRVGFTNAQGQPGTVAQGAITDPTGAPKAVPGLTGPHGELQTGLSPSAQAAAGVSGTGNAGMAMQLQQRAARVPDNKAILGNLDGLLDNFQPGPQSGFWKKFGQIAAEYGIKIPGAPPATKIAAQEEFGKLAFQLAQSQFQALGGTGTDSKLDSTMHTSPSEMLSKFGNKGIIALLKGNEDAVAAQNDAWQKWQQAGHGPDTYGQFQAQWNKLYDPRVFQSVYQTPAERQNTLKGMTADEQKKFRADYERAVGLGWINR